jgi:hypothetical protein
MFWRADPPLMSLFAASSSALRLATARRSSLRRHSLLQTVCEGYCVYTREPAPDDSWRSEQDRLMSRKIAIAGDRPPI